MRIPSETAEHIAMLQGEIRGSTLQTDAAYIQWKGGAEAVERVEERFAELNYPLSYNSVQAMSWYPFGMRILSLLIIQECFDLTDEDIKTMGNMAPKSSFVVKLIMKFFMSPETAIRNGPTYWPKYTNVGNVVMNEIDIDQGFFSFHFNGLQAHPIYCKYLEGFLERLIQYLFPKADVQCNELECAYQDGCRHLFKITWETQS